MTYINKVTLTIITLFFFNTSLFAHYIWIEAENRAEMNQEQIIKIYYGEFNEGLREIKGGRLEELEGIQSWVIDPNGQKSDLKVTKRDNYYEVRFTPSSPGKHTIMAVNTVREVVDWSKHGIGVVKPVYYASKEITVGDNVKKQLVQINEYSDMVIVPSENNDSSQPTFQLLFKGKPFAETKLFVHAPNEWSKEYKTDENGVFGFDPLWKGVYVMECIYKEEKEGVFVEKKYEAVRHRATYTYIE